MITTTLTGLFITAISIAVLHAALPNHWMMIVLIARAHRWSKNKTMYITALAGLCHVISTTILGFLVAWIGWKLSEVVGGIVTPLAAVILVIRGFVYITFYFRHISHSHGELDEIPSNDKSAILTVLALLTFSPCEALLPIYFAASPYGWQALGLLALILAIGTIGFMVLFTSYAYSKAGRVSFPWLEKHEPVILGGILILLGAIVVGTTEDWMLQIAHQIPGIAYGVIIESWKILKEASIYLLFGFLIAGMIKLLIPDEKVAKYMGGKGTKPVLYGSLIGIPIPLCSCGVIPTAIGLRKQGASKGSTLSFLVSTPETGVDSIAITYALIDPMMTIFRPLAAFVTATVTGITENIFGKEDAPLVTHDHAPGEACTDNCSEKSVYTANREKSILTRLGMGIRYGFIELLGDLAKWLIIGILAAGVISYLIPPGFVENYLGSDRIAMLVMVIVGIPLYVCATASTPIAAALILKGLSPGAALVFLLTGPATNIATITVIAKYFGKRSIIVYLVSVILCALLFGILLNQLYYFLDINPIAVIGKAGELIPVTLQTIGAWVLLLLIPLAWYKERKDEKESSLEIITDVAHEHPHQ